MLGFSLHTPSFLQGAIALFWFFLTHQLERILDWTNTGVWYSRLLKLAGVAFVFLPPLFILVSYPLEWSLVSLNNLLNGDPLASIGFGLQVALIYYPVTFSVLAAIAGLEGTRQLAVSRVTNNISRPFTPQLMQLVGMAWYLIMVPGLLLYKTAIGWVGFMTAFYVSFFVKSAIARFVGYTVQRTEGDPQWEQSPANPREIDPEVRQPFAISNKLFRSTFSRLSQFRTSPISLSRHVLKSESLP